MTRTIPSEYQRPGTREMLPDGEIRASEWRLIARGQNYLWANEVARLDGAHFEPDHVPAFFVDTNGLGPDGLQEEMRDLEDWTGFGRLTRPDDNDDVHLTVAALVKQVEVGWTIRIPFHFERQDAGKTLSTRTDGNNTDTLAWIYETFTIPASEFDSDPAAINAVQPVAVDVVAGRYEEDGFIRQIGIWESIISDTAKLPRTRFASI